MEEEGSLLYFHFMMSLSQLHMERYNCSEQKVDIDAAIGVCQRVMGVDSKTSHYEAGTFAYLSHLLMVRYLLYKNDKDLTDGNRCAEEELKRTPKDDPAYATRLADLGRWSIYKCRGKGVSSEDRDQAIEYCKTSLKMMPCGGSNHVGQRVRMLMACQQHMQWSLDGPDWMLSVARNIEDCKDELARLPPGERGVVAFGYFNLSHWHWKRYDKTGDPADLEKAVEHCHAAVSKGPESGTVRASALDILSGYLISRYNRLGAMEDIDMSISVARQAADLIPVGHPERPRYVGRLCQRLIDRFRRVGEPAMDDLNAAITLAELSMDATDNATSESRGGPPRFEIILADALYLRYTTLPILFVDLRRAIALAHTAVRDEGGQYNVERSEIFHRLGRFLRARFRHTNELGDIDSAILSLKCVILSLKRASGGTSVETPAQGEVLDDLGRFYLLRYRAKQNEGPDGKLSHQSFLDAWNTISAPPLIRIRAAQRVGLVYESSKRFTDAAALYEACVSLMPQVSLPFLSRVDPQRLLAMLTGIASRAATCALLVGKGAKHALKLLDLGRGIIAGFLIDCRSDMTDLQSDHPDLCRELWELRREMEDRLAAPANAEGWQQLGPENVMTRRKIVMARMEEVLQTVRGLPGYEGFLRSPSTENLMALAASGPIVVVNASVVHCHAIIVTSGAIRSVALQKWDSKRAVELLSSIKDLVKGNISNYADRTKKMQKLLIWLWNVVVSPILSAIGIDGPPSPQAEPPHIWWIGTGPLGLAPFHAAGHHTEGSTKNTISRVVSSYTPSIKALQYSRQKPEPAGHIKDLLLVSMPTTEGQSDLKGVTKELEHIVDIVKPVGVATKLMEHPKVPEVLLSLSDCQAVHFACHGAISAQDPSSGGLLLQDGRLTVADVAAKSGCAMIAYLSACSTAQTGDSLLVDEGITLAAAFQMAGFRHVVGTMWEGRDKVCVAVAQSFYQNVIEGRSVAKALHDAVVKARGVGDGQTGNVLNWAPFIHNGA